MKRCFTYTLLFCGIFLSHYGHASIIDVFFSPDDPIADHFVAYVDSEKKSIDIAIYTLTNEKIMKSLRRAHERGVAVCVILDEYSLMTHAKNRARIEQLIKDGIEVYLFDPKSFYSGGSGSAQCFFNKYDFLSGYKGAGRYFKPEPLPYEQIKQLSIRPVLHHKFCIFGQNINDNKLVWTGSFNFTYFGAARNQENAMVIDSADVASAYKRQFELIKSERAHRLLPYPIAVDGDGLELFFAPDQRVLDRLIDLIDHEQQQIRMAMYSLSNKDVVEALIRAHERGVDVEVLLDHGKKAMLARAGVSVYLFIPEKCHAGSKNTQLEPIDRRGKVYALMHNKFCIFAKNNDDKRLLWTGSTNCTYFSDQIFQNNALITDNANIIDRYNKQYELIKNYRTMIYEK